MEALQPVVESRNWKILQSDLRFVPKISIDLDSAAIQANIHLIEALENHDDVQNVYYNISLPEEALA